MVANLTSDRVCVAMISAASHVVSIGVNVCRGQTRQSLELLSGSNTVRVLFTSNYLNNRTCILLQTR